MRSAHAVRARCVLAALRREHCLVRRALRVLEGQAAHVDIGGLLPAQDIGRLARFFRGFFFEAHCAKEQQLLCPAVALHGSDREAELTGTLLREQDETRELLHSLELFDAPAAELAEEERRGFVETARTCVRRLARLIDEEEASLFSVALACLPLDERLTLQEAFEELDRRQCSAADWESELADLESTWTW